MKRWCLWLGLMVCALMMRAAEGGMRASKPEVRKEVVAVIEAQLAAFRAGDLVKAHSYASSELRAQRPVRLFAAMVQANYAEIWANTRAEFGLVRDDGMQATLLVEVFAKSGAATYDFTLVKERVGWRVAAVLRHAPRAAEKV